MRFFISRLGGIGDVILTTPLLRAIKQKYPDSQIVLSVHENGREAVEGLPYIDEVVAYRKTTADFIRMVKRIWHFDAAVFFDWAYRPSLMAWLAGVRVRTGVGHKRTWMLTKPMTEAEAGILRYEPYNLANLLQIGTGIDFMQDDLTQLDIAPFSQAIQEKTRATLQQHALQDKQFFAVAPFTSFAPRDWSGEKYVELIDKLKETHHLPVVLIGAPNDCERARKIADATSVVNLVGQTSFLEMAAIIEKAVLLVGACSGHMHAATAVKTPTVIIYGPGSPTRWAPRARCRIAYLKYPCSPCSLDWENNPCARECLEQITSDMVIGEIEKALEGEYASID